MDRWVLVVTIVSAFVLMGTGGIEPVWSQGDYYFGMNYGVVFREDVDDSRSGIGEAVFEEPCCRSWHVDLRFGHEDGGRWLTRLETELTFESVDVNRYTLTGGGSSSGLGDWESTGLMVNGYRDFYPEAVVESYLGAGAGWIIVNADSNGTAQPIRVRNSFDGTWAAQALAGLRKGLMASTDLLLQYRYRTTGDLEYVDLNNVRFDINGVQDHQVEMGFQVKF